MTSHWTFGWDQVAAFANTAAILFAAWIAKRSVGEWRQERLEARQSEVAEEALSLAYQAPEVFARIRSAAGFSGEGSSREAGANETEEEKEALNRAFVPIERILKEAQFFERVSEIRPRVDALFGKGQARPFDELLKIRWEIVGAAHVLARKHQRQHFRTSAQEEKHLESIEKYESVIWAGLEEEDKVEIRIRNAVASIEALAEPILRSRFRRRSR